MHRLLLFFIPLLFLGSCQQHEDVELQKLYDEVMEIHDDVMPEMSTIHKLSKKLKASIKTNPDNKSTLDLALQNLSKADDGMMDWMQAFKKPKTDNKEDIKKYYLLEKARITKVRDDMKNSISAAQKILPKE